MDEEKSNCITKVPLLRDGSRTQAHVCVRTAVCYLLLCVSTSKHKVVEYAFCVSYAPNTRIDHGLPQGPLFVRFLFLLLCFLVFLFIGQMLRLMERPSEGYVLAIRCNNSPYK